MMQQLGLIPSPGQSASPEPSEEASPPGELYSPNRVEEAFWELRLWGFSEVERARVGDPAPP
jgi:hypothetical protein